jgi:uncharacterized membrane protein YgcG
MREMLMLKHFAFASTLSLFLINTVFAQWPTLAGSRQNLNLAAQLRQELKFDGYELHLSAPLIAPHTAVQNYNEKPTGVAQNDPLAPNDSVLPARNAESLTTPAVLYEEDAYEPRGRSYAGRTIWRTEMVLPSPGLAPEPVVRADIVIPDQRIAVTWKLRRNSDKGLPASHTIEINFNLPSSFPGGSVENVPGILMKQEEQAKGTPLIGFVVGKVAHNSFLIGLSAADVQHNVQLLKHQEWFDVPIVYANGARAILAVDKGLSGDRAFSEAFANWEGSASGDARAELNLPALTGPVIDQAGILDGPSRAMLTQKLRAFEAQSTNQLVVVTLTSLQGTSIENFGLRLFNYWHLGQKDKNNGVLLIVAPNERRVRIEVGYGLEDTLTDATAKNILDDTVTPMFGIGKTASFIEDHLLLGW